MAEFWHWLKSMLDAAGYALLASGAGRFAWHLYAVKAGERKMLGVGLALEIIVALLMAIVAVGVGEWLGLGAKATGALAGVFGWLGPKGLEAWAVAVLERRRAGKPDD